MASRKEYEMLFQLNAQMNGGFSGTFTKAQSEFAKLGNEIQNLSKVQSDISAYQKQQSAVEATTAKLENLKQQHDLLQKEINETTGSTANLEREKLKLEQRISDTEAALERQNQKLDTTGAKLQAAGIGTSNLSAKSAELTARIDDLKDKQKEAADEAQSFGETSVSAFEAVSSAITAAGLAAALKEIADAYMDCVTIAADFEETMSTVEALSGASSDELAQLNAMAKELGATTKFTATESAEAMTYMAMAGWDANQMLAGMDGVLQLAAASGEDLAMVSDIVTDNLTAFGLAASDTAHFSDVLAAAATNSNTSVAIMGETFKNCAAIAGALNYSVDDVAVAVGLMANAGIKGSNAGTALKNTLNGLVSGVTLTSAAFGDYEFSAVKADGTMKDFATTVDELRSCFDQMTEAERFSNAQAIAGERTYNGLLAILNATDEEYASLRTSIAECSGAAATMAAIKLDNLNGELTLMNSAWDALKTTIGEQFIPEMRTLYSVGTDVFGVMDEFVQENPALVKSVAAFVGVLGAATVGMTAYAAISKVVKALDMAAMFTNPVFAAIAGVAALTAIVVAVANAEKDAEQETRTLTAASRAQYEELQELNAEYEAAKENYGETSDEALLLRYEVEELTASYEANKQTLEELIAENDALIAAHDQIMASYAENTTAIDGEEQSIRALVLKLEELSQKTSLTDAEQQQMLTVVDALNEAIPELALNFDTATGSLNLTADAIREIAKAQLEREQQVEEYQTWLELTKEELTLSEQLEKAKENLRIRQEELVAAGYNLDGALTRLQTDLDDYEDEVDRLTAAYKENQSALAAMEQQQEETAASGDELSGIIEGVTERMAELTEAYNEAYGAALESIQGQYGLWDEAAEVAATSASSINSALESQITYWQDYNANLQSLTERSADIEGLSEVIATFADGSADSVNAIAGLANASDEDLRAMVANWQELQKEQKAASGSIADLKTDFTATMDEMQEEFAADIDAMSLPDEAAESARSTIQAFIDQADGMLPQVQAAYARLAQVAASAMGLGFTSMYGTGSGTGNTTLPTTPGYDYLKSAGNSLIGLPGYASGTPNATPGAAIVGEEGPELVYFRGGEQVIPAAQTAAMLDNSRSSVQISVPVVVQVEGNATQDVVESLREFGDELTETVTERVMDALENERVDAARRAYR